MIPQYGLCIYSGTHSVPMIPLGLKETTECDLAVPIKVGTTVCLNFNAEIALLNFHLKNCFVNWE